MAIFLTCHKKRHNCHKGRKPFDFLPLLYALVGKSLLKTPSKMVFFVPVFTNSVRVCMHYPFQGSRIIIFILKVRAIKYSIKNLIYYSHKVVKVSLLKKEITFYPIFNTYDIQAIRFVLQKDGFAVEDVDER